MRDQARLLADIHAALAELRAERHAVKVAESSVMLDLATERLVRAEDRMFALLSALDRDGGLAALADLARRAGRAA